MRRIAVRTLKCLAWTFVFLVLGLGCGGRSETRPDGVQGAPVHTEAAKKRFLNPLLQIATWPFDDGKSQYRLFWDGGESKLPLFAEPDPNSAILGELRYSNGDEIETVGDYVSIYQPAIFRTKTKQRISGRVHNPGDTSHDEKFSKELRKGASIAVYMFAGSGGCYVGVGGRIITAPCPTPDLFVGHFEGPSPQFQMQPLEKIWWVKVSTPIASGWVPLDDRVVADILPLDSNTDTAVAKTPSGTPAGEEAQPASGTAEEASREDALFGAEEVSREDGLFGETASVDGGEQDPALSQGESNMGFGSPVLTDEEIGDRLEAQDDPLTIGAFAFLELNYAALDEGSFEEFDLGVPSLLDVYLDARPSERVRAYARGRLRADFGLAAFDDESEPIENVLVELDQFWVKFDVAQKMFVTVGKQRAKWGTGRFWNPTDFLNRTPRNALNVNVFDSRLGVTLAKLHFPVESLGWNSYVVAQLEQADSPKRVGAALRSEFLHQLTELSLSAAVRKDEPLRFGADLSTSIWLFDFHAEGALMYRDPRPYYRGEVDIPSILPQEFGREEAVIPQVVVGAELQIPYRRGDLFVLGGEFFYNDAGYPDESWYPWLFDNGRYTAFYAGRRYAAAYAALLGPGNWEQTSFYATVLGNFSDESYVARLDIAQTALSYLRWNVFGNFHFGNTGEFNYALELEPNIFAPEGVSIVRPLFEAGAGLQIDL